MIEFAWELAMNMAKLAGAVAIICGIVFAALFLFAAVVNRVFGK